MKKTAVIIAIIICISCIFASCSTNSGANDFDNQYTSLTTTEKHVEPFVARNLDVDLTAPSEFSVDSCGPKIKILSYRTYTMSNGDYLKIENIGSEELSDFDNEEMDDMFILELKIKCISPYKSNGTSYTGSQPYKVYDNYGSCVEDFNYYRFNYNDMKSLSAGDEITVKDAVSVRTAVGIENLSLNDIGKIEFQSDWDD